jgi:hypothetical protein
MPNDPAGRRVIDGKGATTVINGNRRGEDTKFTFENQHASANWDGFHDDECGLSGYTWAVGSKMCDDDIVAFTDPHSAHPDPRDWTHTGFAKGLQLNEGAYFVTVQVRNVRVW